MSLDKEISRIEDIFLTPLQVETYENDEGSSSYSFDTRRQIAIISFMSASQYLTGDRDELGVKPFYNIVNQIVDLEVRATDIDTKNIILRPNVPNYDMEAMLATKALHNWLRDKKFGKTLNKLGETLARYGNVLLKRSYDTTGEICVSVCNWSSMTFDPFDIARGPKLEIHYMQAIDFEKKRGIWDDTAIDMALDELEQLDDEFYLKVTEVEAELPRKVFTENWNTKGISLQHYFVVRDSQKYDQICLFKEELKESNYKYYGRKELDGRGWALGVVEQGQNAQVEINLIKIMERRSLELASKKLYLTNDDELEDSNFFVDKENGDVVYSGKEVTELSTFTNALPLYENVKESWLNQFKASLSAFDAVTGESMPSGTAYRLGLLQAKQASSMFDYLKQGKGMFVEEVITDWVLQEVAKGINRQFVLSAGFTPQQLDVINERFATSLANKEIIKQIERGKLPTSASYQAIIDDIKQGLSTEETQFIDIPKGMFKNIKNKVKVIVVDESEDVQAKIDTLSSFLQVAQNDPEGIIFGPDGVKNIVKEISRLTNISLVGLGVGEANKPTPQQTATVDLSDMSNTMQQDEQGISQVL